MEMDHKNRRERRAVARRDYIAASYYYADHAMRAAARILAALAGASAGKNQSNGQPVGYAAGKEKR